MLTSAPLSGRLRAAPTQEHGDAEASAFMTAVMTGGINAGGYAALVVQLQNVYDALEAAAAGHREQPVFGPFFDPRLRRDAALAADLAVLGDHRHPITAATTAYADHLQAVADDALSVLAHHYTRYLGDLSGGRAIAARLQHHLGLTPESGLAFYQFDVGPAPAYKNAYRQRLDDLDLTYGEQERFIGEVRTAYALNSGIFASLDHLL